MKSTLSINLSDTLIGSGSIFAAHFTKPIVILDHHTQLIVSIIFRDTERAIKSLKTKNEFSGVKLD